MIKELIAESSDMRPNGSVQEMAQDNNLQANDLDNYLLKNNRRFKLFIYKKQHASQSVVVEETLKEFFKRYDVQLEG